MVKIQANSGRKNRISNPKSDTLFLFLMLAVLILITLCVLYPLVYVVSASLSDPKAVVSGKVVILPVGLSVDGYKAVFEDRNILGSFFNSVLYTVLGTVISVCITMTAAYPLAQRDLPFKGVVMGLFTFTMIFSGGMIPAYLLVSKLRMLNTIWAIVIPGCLGVYNMIIARTFIQGLPATLKEASEIDGCSDIRYFFFVVVPLSPAIIAVLTIYYAVGYWSNYFSAFLYLTNRDLYPLQIILREILLKNQIAENSIQDSESAMRVGGMAELLKYSLIVITSLPMLLLYPFIQKYFIKGVMIGSIKE